MIVLRGLFLNRLDRSRLVFKEAFSMCCNYVLSHPKSSVYSALHKWVNYNQDATQ